MTYHVEDLFDLSQTEHGALFQGVHHAWDPLKRLGEYIRAHVRPVINNASVSAAAIIGPQVFIGEGTVVEAGAMILGPAIIGSNCQIRHNAYLRENVIVGNECVVGNSCELKHAVLFNGCQVPHFNYVGDSILGHRAHLGAGAIVSNVKLDHQNVWVDCDGTPVDTGLRKFGGLLGDFAEIGCNAVLNPGSIIGKRSVIYPGMSWRGILPSHMIAKTRSEMHVVVRRPRET
jgi:UDP-N-acetylglucosamine diphosphorylase / glucose-1-phosphate thymidylyltransferase / UDP-N-acetylgalactosamine diphosphorylase / glucosamine-1-phosphate N-acetyltransferase / galactosamine-1-phosphate N-acetyltransferase